MSSSTKRIRKDSKIVRSSKADKLVETYHELGFSHAEQVNGASVSNTNTWLAPVSFLPHVDYTISSVIGGY